MDEWEYRTIHMELESWERMHEHYEDYVATYADGVRLEGVETVLRRYLDDGGWELLSIFPTHFRSDSATSTHANNFTADTLTLIFRRKRPVV